MMKKTQQLIIVGKKMAAKYAKIVFNARQCINEIENVLAPILEKHRTLIPKDVINHYDEGLMTAGEIIDVYLEHTHQLEDQISKALHPIIMKYWDLFTPDVQNKLSNGKISSYHALQSIIDPALDVEWNYFNNRKNPLN